uniref:Uncharacterized protein n=1 Tax=Avena sativa TaxID=4498 RepID=A0ACD5YAT9_AVESA
MNRIRRIAGMGKPKVPSAVQKDKDESIVFFRELYKHEKDTDVNLLEPMYSVEFDAIQGGHMSKPPPARRDLLMPIAEKHDYDWLKTTPATSLFPSLEVEANSSKMVFQELPIPRPVKPFASRFLGRPDATKKASPPPGPSPKNLSRGAPPISNEKNQRSTHTALPSRQQKAAAVSARATTPTGSNSAKKQSDRLYTSQDGGANATTETVESSEVPYKAPKNLLTTGSRFMRRPPSTAAAVKAPSAGPAFAADAEGGVRSRRPPPCPPAAVARGLKDPQVDSRKNVLAAKAKEVQVDSEKNVLPAKAKPIAATGSESACNDSGHAGEDTRAKGMRTADGKSGRRRPRFADK